MLAEEKEEKNKISNTKINKNMGDCKFRPK